MTKPVSYVRVDTDKVSETALPNPKLHKIAVSTKNIRRTKNTLGSNSSLG